jgi:hypothetical protein
MANERDRMTNERNRDDATTGGMGDREGGSRRDESPERFGDESSAERMRGIGDDLEEDEFEETEEDTEEEEEEDGTV